MRKVALGAALFVAAAVPVFFGSKVNAEATQRQEEKPKIIVVEKGDYLSKIAREHNTTYHRIYYANENIEHPDLIYPDERFRIPASDEKLSKRAMPEDARVPAETEADKRQNRYNYSSKPAQASAASAPSGDVWDRLAACESGGNWSINTGNGYYGGLQFTLGTWQAVGGAGYPHQASKAEQIKRGQILQARSGWDQWPACTAKLGLR